MLAVGRRSLTREGATAKAVAVAFVVLFASVEPLVGAMPCPHNALFIAGDLCACEPDLRCFGSECGSATPKLQQPQQRVFFVSRGQELGVATFPASCLDCLCAQGEENHEALLKALEPSFSIVSFKGSLRREFHDPLFQHGCGDLLDPSSHTASLEPGEALKTTIPPPRALPRLRWLHYPKCVLSSFDA